MTPLILLATAALAEPSYYHSSDVSTASDRFAEATDVAAERFEAASAEARDYAAALRRYETNLDLLGERAPSAERERYATLEQQFHRDFASLQAFVGDLVDEYYLVFSQSLDRAVAGLPQVPVSCEATVSAGPRGLRVPGRTAPNPDCVGMNVNDQIAAAIDADPELIRAVEVLGSRAWPAVGAQELMVAQAPVGVADRYVRVGVLFEQGARNALLGIERVDADARMDIDMAVESGVSADELASLKQEADAITLRTARARTMVAEPVFGAVDKLLAKRAKRGERGFGWCANPSSLGGCAGEDASSSLVRELLDDKSVSRSMPN